MDAVDWMVMAGKTLSVPSFASSVSSASSGLRRTTLPSIYLWQRHQGWHHSKPPGGQFRYGWPSPLHNQMLIVSICNSLSMGGWGRAAAPALVSRSFPLPPDDDERISWVVAVAKELYEGSSVGRKRNQESGFIQCEDSRTQYYGLGVLVVDEYFYNITWVFYINMYMYSGGDQHLEIIIIIILPFI